MRRGRRWSPPPAAKRPRPGRAAAAAAAGWLCAMRRPRDRAPVGTDTAGRGPRRSPTRAPPPVTPRPPAVRAGGPSTGRPATPPGTVARRARSLCSGISSKIDAWATDSPSTLLRRVPDEPGSVAREVHRQRGVARLQQAAVGHEVGAAHGCDGASVVAEADQRAVIAAGHRAAVFGLVGVAQPEPDRPGSNSLAQCAIRVEIKTFDPGHPYAGQQRLAGPCRRFHQQQVPGTSSSRSSRACR